MPGPWLHGPRIQRDKLAEKREARSHTFHGRFTTSGNYTTTTELNTST
jgi:hypothetical protein